MGWATEEEHSRYVDEIRLQRGRIVFVMNCGCWVCPDYGPHDLRDFHNAPTDRTFISATTTHGEVFDGWIHFGEPEPRKGPTIIMLDESGWPEEIESLEDLLNLVLGPPPAVNESWD